MAKAKAKFATGPATISDLQRGLGKCHAGLAFIRTTASRSGLAVESPKTSQCRRGTQGIFHNVPFLSFHEYGARPKPIERLAYAKASQPKMSSHEKHHDRDGSQNA
jgi:hypothetical protein